MMVFGIVVWLAAVPPVLQQAVPVSVSGVVPERLDSPTWVSWLPAETETPEAGCILVPPRQWTCSGLPAGARGVVSISGNDSVGFVVLYHETLERRPPSRN